MKNLFVKKTDAKKNLLISEIDHILETQTVSHSIDHRNWESFDYKPNVLFRIAHCTDEIWLKFEVKEKNIRAVETKINGDVYKDSCVEFFISFNPGNYYNLEFNCIGIPHVAYGKGRNNRKFVSEDLIKKMEIVSSLGNRAFTEKSGNFNWQMVIRIPVEIFSYSDIKSYNGIKAKANFYKCGDETSTPHYLTWNPVNTVSPDYHRSEFFGNLLFEE